GQLLMNRGDAGAARVDGRAKTPLRPRDTEITGERGLDARDDPDERALPGAVFAHERVHLAGGDAEVDPLPDFVRPERFSNVPELDRVRHSRAGASTGPARDQRGDAFEHEIRRVFGDAAARTFVPGRGEESPAELRAVRLGAEANGHGD